MYQAFFVLLAVSVVSCARISPRTLASVAHHNLAQTDEKALGLLSRTPLTSVVKGGLPIDRGWSHLELANDTHVLPLVPPLVFAMWHASSLAYTTYSIGQNLAEIVKDAVWKNRMTSVAGGVISETNALFQSIAKGSINSSALLRSEYLQLQKLEADLATIKTFCHREPGILDWWLQWGLPSFEVSARITSRAEGILDIFSKVSEDMFCGDFEAWLQQHISIATDILMGWEARTGLLWFPKRELPNRFFVGVSDPEHVQRLEHRFGLSKQQISRQADRAAVWAVRSRGGPNMYVNHYTTFPDRLQNDPSEESTNKDKLRSAIQEMRLLFNEMARLSPRCAQRATEMQKRSPLCDNCPFCCKMPGTHPSLFQWLTSKMTKLFKSNENVEYAFTNMMDVSSIGFAARGSPTSAMSLAAELVKTPFTKDLCNEADRLLHAEEILLEERPTGKDPPLAPQEEQEEQIVSTMLPEPGDSECRDGRSKTSFSAC